MGLEIRRTNSRNNEGASDRGYRCIPSIFLHQCKQFGLLRCPDEGQNLQQTFDRVLASAGVSKGQPGAHPHGLRHFYVWYYENELQLSESDGQMMLNHRRIESQRAYGRDAKTLNEKIATKLGERHAA